MMIRMEELERLNTPPRVLSLLSGVPESTLAGWLKGRTPSRRTQAGMANLIAVLDTFRKYGGFGGWLQARMIMEVITVKDLAERLDVAPVSIKGWVLNDYAPSTANLKRLFKILPFTPELGAMPSPSLRRQEDQAEEQKADMILYSVAGAFIFFMLAWAVLKFF